MKRISAACLSQALKDPTYEKVDFKAASDGVHFDTQTYAESYAECRSIAESAGLKFLDAHVVEPARHSARLDGPRKMVVPPVFHIRALKRREATVEKPAGRLGPWALDILKQVRDRITPPKMPDHQVAEVAGEPA